MDDLLLALAWVLPTLAVMVLIERWVSQANELKEYEVIKSVAKVVVPVDDQERALEFWTKGAGFDVSFDESYGDERWIEVAPPGSGPVLVLSPRRPDQTRPDVPEMLPHSPVLFTCDDIHATYAEMRERGVEFSEAPVQQHFGWWALFTDPDGTRYALGQW